MSAYTSRPPSSPTRVIFAATGGIPTRFISCQSGRPSAWPRETFRRLVPEHVVTDGVRRRRHGRGHRRPAAVQDREVPRPGGQRGLPDQQGAQRGGADRPSSTRCALASRPRTQAPASTH